MKIKIKKVFRYQFDAVTVKKLYPGVYDVGRDITQHVADSALRFGKAEVVVEKKAPENKIVQPAANKAKVAKKSGHRRSTRTKPDE